MKATVKLKTLVATIGVAGALALVPGSASAVTVPTITITPSTAVVGVPTDFTVTSETPSSYDDTIQSLEVNAPTGVTLNSTPSDIDGGSLASGHVYIYLDGHPLSGAISKTTHITATADTVGTTDWTLQLNPHGSPSALTHPTLTVTASPTPTPTPTATPSPTPSPEPGAGTTPSAAMTQFLEIFFTVTTTMAALIVPFLVLTWVLRLLAELIRGGKS